MDDDVDSLCLAVKGWGVEETTHALITAKPDPFLDSKPSNPVTVNQNPPPYAVHRPPLSQASLRHKRMEEFRANLRQDAERNEQAEQVRTFTTNQGSASSYQTTLQTLPSELLRLVVNSADRKDLISLRSTCRDIAECALEPFCKAYFTERKHIISEHSLQALVDITASPVFGPFVRTIMLGSCSICPDTTQELTEMIDSASDGLLYSQARQIKSDVIHKIGDRVEFERLHYDQDMIVEALNNVHKHGNTVNIGLWSDVIDSPFLTNIPGYFTFPCYSKNVLFSGWGSRRAYGSEINGSGSGSAVTFVNLPDDLFKAICEAIVKSDCRVDGLVLPLNHMREDVSSFEELWDLYSGHASDREPTKSALLNIRKIQVRYHRTIGCNSQPDLPQYQLDRLCDITSKCHNLEKLSPGLAFGFECPDIRLETTHLRLLHLADTYGDIQTFADIIGQHRRSLKSLSVERLTIMGRNGLRHFVRWLMKRFTLDRLHLSKIAGRLAVPVKEHYELPISGDSVTYVGAEEIRGGLEELLASLAVLEARVSFEYYGNMLKLPFYRTKRKRNLQLEDTEEEEIEGEPGQKRPALRADDNAP